MKKLLGLFIIISLSITFSFGQKWTRVQSWGLDLEALVWANDSIGFAVGENLIIQSKDGGATWEESQVTFEGKLLAVDFWNAEIGIAVGEHGLIYKTTNSGKTWTLKNSNTKVTLSGVSFISENKLFAIGKSGIILSSIDQGETWAPTSSSTTLDLNEISKYNQDTIYIATNQGGILSSYDAGDSWAKINTGQAQHLKSVVFSTPLLGVAVGIGGTIVKTIDGGKSWSTQHSGVTTDLKKIAISPLDPRIFTIVGDSATALRSTNSANTFGKASLGAGNVRDLKSLSYKAASNHVYAVGSDGHLLHSSNAGASYKQILAGSRNHYAGADFKSDKIGYIIGNKSSAILTTNGGLSFVSRPVPEEMDLLGFDFWNSNFGYVGGEFGKIYRTGNSARNWVAVPAPTSNSITGFYLFAPSVLYATGTNGYIASSFDSGGSWSTPKESNTTTNLKDLTFFDYQVGFAIGEKGEILWSNGGTTWEKLPKLTEKDLNALAKVDSTTAIVVGNNGVILRGTNQAREWELIETGISENLHAVDFWDKYLGFIAGDNGLTLQTKDGGKTWVKIPTGTSRNLRAISAGNPLIVYAAGDDGTILKYECTIPIELGEISGANESCLTQQFYSIPDTGIIGLDIVWRVDGGEIIAGQGTHEILVEWKTAGRNGVYVSNQNFCGNGKTSSMEVIISDSPIATKPIQGEGAVCIGQNYTYSYLAQSGVEYQWNISGGEILSGQGSAEIEVSWNEVGSKEIILIQSNACGTAAAVQMPISVNSPPAQPAPISGLDRVALEEVQYEIPSEEGIIYTWEITGNGGKIIEGQGSSKVRVLWEKEGDYVLSVTPENQCNQGEKRTLPVNVNIITSVPEKETLALNIYPNPSEGILNIEFAKGKWKEVSLHNTLGQELNRIVFDENTAQLKLVDLPKGILILHFNSSKEVVTRKVLIK